MKKLKPIIVSMLSLLGMAIAMPSQADRAIVVGVNSYPNLGNHNLRGCVNDARAMAAALQRYHFNVTLLTDQQATHQKILDALTKTQSEIKPNERFVFYFAGHGTPAAQGGASVLPSDTLPESYDNDLLADDLNKQIHGIGAKSWTVILDTCFSGGMLRVSRGPKHSPTYLSRLYIRRVPPAFPPETISAEPAAKMFAESGVCYFTAAQKDETAGEEEFDGRQNGIFTHLLVGHMHGQPIVWGDLERKISSEIAIVMSGKQHPSLSHSFVSTPIFDAPTMAFHL